MWSRRPKQRTVWNQKTKNKQKMLYCKRKKKCREGYFKHIKLKKISRRGNKIQIKQKKTLKS